MMRAVSAFCVAGLAFSAAGTTYQAQDYGLAGDGVTDDGPALRKMLADALADPQDARLTFESGKTYLFRTGQDGYVFPLDRVSDLTIDGGGSTFLIDSELRFMSLTHSRNVAVLNLAVDFDPLPFRDGVIVAKNAQEQLLDVRVLESFDMPPLDAQLDPPDAPEDEQAYFGMVWFPGPFTATSAHYMSNGILESGSTADRVVRIHGDGVFTHYDDIVLNETVISLPVRGIAHRYGPGHCILVQDNDTVTFDNIRVWTAPWFVFGVFRNSGDCDFRNIHVRPKPDTQRHMSSWRDCFHVKANMGSLLFEDCYLEGMNDDAFNIATHYSRVREVETPTRLRLRQTIPLLMAPMRVGDTLKAYAVREGRMLGQATITRVEGIPQEDPPVNEWPDITVEIDAPIAAIDRETIVWDANTSNPNTILRRCTINMSSRLRSPVTIEDCTINAFTWFQTYIVEGPLPSDVIVKNSRLRIGRGNPTIAASVDTELYARNGERIAPVQPEIKNMLFSNSEIHGDFMVNDADGFAFENIRFTSDSPRFILNRMGNVLLRGVILNARPLTQPSQLTLQETIPETRISIEQTGDSEDMSLMKPYPHWYTERADGRRMRGHYLELTQQAQVEHVGEVTLASETHEAYRLSLPPNSEIFQGLYLDEALPDGFDGLAFFTHADAELACRVYLEEGESRREIYTSGLQSGVWQQHALAIPAAGGSTPRNLLIVLALPEAAAPATLHLGSLRLLREVPASAHSADADADFTLSLSELLGVVQFYNAGAYHCAADGYAPGAGDHACRPHDSDWREQDWRISLGEMLRTVQLHSAGGYSPCAPPADLEGDGYCFAG